MGEQIRTEECPPHAFIVITGGLRCSRCGHQIAARDDRNVGYVEIASYEAALRRIQDLLDKLQELEQMRDEIRVSLNEAIEKRRDVEHLLAEAALAIPECSGPVHDRVRLLRHHYFHAAGEILRELTQAAKEIQIGRGKNQFRRETFEGSIESCHAMRRLVDYLWEVRTGHDAEKS